MNEVLWSTLVVGGGLVACGYALGYMRGTLQGSKEVIDELFQSGAIKPEEILKHYSNLGNDRARETLARLNKYKRDQANKDTEN